MQNGKLYKFCLYYFYFLIGTIALDGIIIMLTEYGRGNYCYVTDAMTIGMKCNREILGHGFIEAVLNFPFILVTLLMFSLGMPLFLIGVLIFVSPLIYLYKNKPRKRTLTRRSRRAKPARDAASGAP